MTVLPVLDRLRNDCGRREPRPAGAGDRSRLQRLTHVNDASFCLFKGYLDSL
jgi:hypothetical protein